MTELEQGELRVVVPVGFLLAEEQEVAVSVNGRDGRPLPIRLRFIPARAAAVDVSDATPMPISRPRARTRVAAIEDGYPTHDFGGSD